MRLAAARGSGRQAITSDSSEIDVTRTSFQSKNVWTKRRERLFRGVVMGVFQAAGEQQMLDHRAPGVRRRRLVVLLQNLVDLGKLGGAADGGHGDGSLRSWPADPGSPAAKGSAADGSASLSGAAVSLSLGRTCCRIWATAIDRLTP